MKRLLSAMIAGALLSISCLANAAQMSEVDTVVAKFQIQELLYRYALTHNTADPEGYANLFTPDGQFGDGANAIKGHDALLKFAQNEAKKLSSGPGQMSVDGSYHFGFLRTLIANPNIDIVDATHAKGVCYYIVVVADIDNKNNPTVLAEGTYLDEFRKVDGKWLIAKRVPGGNMGNPELAKKLGL